MQIYAYICKSVWLKMIDSSLINGLKYKVNAYGINQQELAKMTGIHQSQISRILSGKVRRTSKNLIILSAYLENLHLKNAKSGGIPRVLEDAIRFSWNGTAQHADALARVITSLRGLSGEDVYLVRGENRG